MASSSKPRKEETPEEIEARKRMILSGQEGGNLSSITPGGEVMMNPDGSNGFTYMGGGGAATDGSNNYKWNEKTGDYRSHGGGIIKLGAMPKQASAGGGGGRNPKKGKNPDKDYKKTPTPGIEDAGPVGTPGIVGGYEDMMDWRPISSDGAGGVQGMNTLVDPNNWMVQVDPKWQALKDPGIYVNPNLPQGMLQDDEETVSVTTSNNPYSLLG